MSFISCSSSGPHRSLAGLNTDFSESIQYSPTGEHAIIVVNGIQGSMGNSLIFVNMLNRTSSGRIAKQYWTYVTHAYWLGSDVISVLTEKENEKFTYFVYKMNMENSTVYLKLIQETNIPYQHVNNISVTSISAHQDPCRINLNGHEFLFIKSYKFMLTPFNPLEGPALPFLNFDITDFVHKLCFGPVVRTLIQCMFACHNNSVFMYVASHKEFLFDQFLKIDLVDFNLISKKVRAKDGHLDLDNLNIVRMTRKSKGEYTMSELPMIWQNKEYDVAYECEHWPRESTDRRVIVVNLEKETVMEKVIKFKFTQVTLYRGFLLFWIVPDSAGKICFKFEWIGEKMPSLRDICTVEMLSQRVENSRFKKFYKNMTKHLY